jgi:hypothetical protein
VERTPNSSWLAGTRVSPPVELVTNLHDDGPSARPHVFLRVEDAGEPQGALERLQVAMDIADRDEALRLREGCAVDMRGQAVGAVGAVGSAREAKRDEHCET